MVCRGRSGTGGDRAETRKEWCVVAAVVQEVTEQGEVRSGVSWPQWYSQNEPG